MAEIQFNQLAALTTPPPLTDRVLIYQNAAFTAPGSLASLANEAAANNPPNTFTLAELRTLMSPDAATESTAGIVLLATTIEAAAGTDTVKAVTAAGVRAAITAPNNAATSTTRGSVELATVDEAVAGTDTTKAVTPEGAAALIAASTGGATFASLTDTPSALGSAGQVPRVNTAGDALEFYSPTTGGGATTFVGLSDTPASLGTSGQFVAVNSARNALEFVDAPSGGGGSDTGAQIVSKLAALSGNARLSYNDLRDTPTIITQAQTNKLAGIETGATADQTGSEIVTLLEAQASGSRLSYTRLDDTPSIPSAETGATIVSKLSALSGNARLPASAINGLPTGGGGATTFTALTDTPSSYAFQEGFFLRVNSTAESLELVPAPNFVSLTDTPSSLGTAGQFIAVNTAANALEFVNAPSGGGGGSDTGAQIVSKLSALTGNARLPYSALSGVPTTITQAQASKLAGIETGATADQSGIEIASLLNGLTGAARIRYSAIANTPTLVTAFTGLSDTPSALTGQGGRFLAVNSAANAVEFVDAPSGGGGGARNMTLGNQVIGNSDDGGELAPAPGNARFSTTLVPGRFYYIRGAGTAAEAQHIGPPVIFPAPSGSDIGRIPVRSFSLNSSANVEFRVVSGVVQMSVDANTTVYVSAWGINI